MPVVNHSPAARTRTLAARRRRAQAALPEHVGVRPCLDVIPASIRPPELGPATVPRTALVHRLLRDDAAVVLLVAGPGYGKTTLLAQWAAAEKRPVAWLSIDARDNDPLVFLKHVAAAVDRAQPLDRRMLTSLGATHSATTPWVLDRAARVLASCRRPFLLALDDAHLLRAAGARRLLTLLIDEAPAGSTVALAGRAASSLSAAAVAAHGNPSRLGPHDLVLSKREAQLLCSAVDDGVGEQEVAALVELCEGWPVALRLAALSLHDGFSRGPAASFDGADHYLADYVRTEHLSRLDPRDVRFLRRTAILDELTAPLCDAVLQEHDSLATLVRLARAGAVVPLEQAGRHRCRRVFRDLLLREEHDEEPLLVPRLHRRAAAWYEEDGDVPRALEHARAAGDADRVARLVGAVALRGSWQSRIPELEETLAEFEQARPLGRHPGIALNGAWIHAFRGRAAEAERWLEVAQHCARRPGASPFYRERVSVLRAALCRTGPRRMLADAGSAIAGLNRADPWYPAALHVRGTAALMLAAVDEADGLLADAVDAAEALGCVETQLVALAQLSLLARDRGDHGRAEDLSHDALELAVEAELERRPGYALALAAAAGSELRHGRWADARELLTAAEPLRASLTVAVPWLAAATRSELARSYLKLRDEDGARTVLAELDGILAARPRLGELALGVAELHRELEELARPEAVAEAGLTPAELRLLPLLGTYLSFREIAERLTVSRNTVKTQAISIYRKLGVSGRSDAMAAAASLRLPGAA